MTAIAQRLSTTGGVFPPRQLFLPVGWSTSTTSNSGRIHNLCKVHIFWEGHKILWNLNLVFDWHYIGKKQGGDFAKCVAFSGYMKFKGAFICYVWVFGTFLNHLPPYVRTFSVHRLRKNCHFLNHLCTHPYFLTYVVLKWSLRYFSLYA